MIQVDIVIPIYNEEEALPALHSKLQQIIASDDFQYRIIYVDDGSSDQTPRFLRELAAADVKVVVIELSRNFGHQAALTAGLDQAEGDYVITMDGDGQHPPELIPELVRLAQAGYDIVLAQRMKGENPRLKEFSSQQFYRLINLIGDTNIRPGISDFRLMKRPVVLALRELREYHRLLRGMVNWMGYRTVILPYHQPERLAGKSKYTIRKMARLAIHAIFSFSLVPLYLGISIGVIFNLAGR
jgi:dolichol-phosphate mannosyltransferase